MLIRNTITCCAQYNASIVVKWWSRQPESAKALLLHYISEAALSMKEIKYFKFRSQLY